jgi:hypothetical protein
MKRLTSIAAIAGLFFFSAASVNSQAPQVSSRAVLADLQAIQASNKALIEKQQKTLETLDALKTAADQLKAFGKRG